MKSIFLLLTLTFISSAAQAKQPGAQEIIQAFLAKKEVASAIKQLKAQGWTIGESSATLAMSDWNDEGIEGVYLVSVYYEKGTEPWERVNGTLTGVANYSMGHIQTLKLLDPEKVAKAMMSVK